MTEYEIGWTEDSKFGYGVEIRLKNPDDFLKVKETLTRIGVATKIDPNAPDEKRSLIQSCHIFHKRGKYYILHFKEMFIIDGLPSSLTNEDIGRRNSIAALLAEWKLIEIVDDEQSRPLPEVPMANIKVIAFNEKHKWNLVYKHKVGNKRK